MKVLNYTWAVFFFVGLFLPSCSYASGFGIFVQGAKALGQADAVVAHAEEPSAVFFNPALINDLSGTQFESGTTMVISNREFQSDVTGETEESDPGIFFPSTLYLTHAVNDRWSVGLGIFSPFGLGTDWGEDWEGRYLATESDITTININPVASYRIHPRLSIAVGLAFLYLDADLNRRINPAIFGAAGLPDGRQQLTGDGTGIGYNGGLLLKITDRLSLGASYRSKIEVDVEGDLKLSVSDALPASTGTGETEISLPQQFFAGLAYRFSDRLTGEVGLRYEGWSSYEELRIQIDHPLLGQITSVENKNWRNTYAYNAGFRYRLDDRITLLGGYLYGENAVPDGTFEPSVPDSDFHLFCIGSDLAFKRFNLAFSYGYQYLDARTKNNEVGAALGGTANGEYRSELHLLAASLMVPF